MMMSAPPSSSTTMDNTDAPPSFATKKPSAVEDLERRLAMLDATDNDSKPPAVATTLAAPAPAPVVTKPVAAAPSRSGKNALLARIQAAKEKSQKAVAAAPVAPPAPAMAPPPAATAPEFGAPPPAFQPPPPAYDAGILQPPPAMPPAPAQFAAPPLAPPAFAAVHNASFPPPPPMESVMPPPPAPAMMAPPAASAPSFESLMETTAPHELANMQALPPPAAPPAAPQIDEDILAALDPAEREALLEEQRQIMEQIEKNKSNNDASSSAARAMAFNQRSSAAVANLAASMDGRSSRSRPTSTAAARPSSRSASSGNTVDLGGGESVPLHGSEMTKQAIDQGTALIIQCMNCQNWMQVTDSASLMLCPICGVVCPVEKTGAATSADMEAAAQLAADQQLAEELQKEEYKNAAGGAERQRRRQQKQAKKAAASSSQSWYDWMMGTPAPAPAPVSQGSAELPSRDRGPRLVAAQTGEETQGLMGGRSGGSGGGGARVAQQPTSLFACVADSVSAAANQMAGVSQDKEGNVHGVDSSSLLAMPNVSRQT